LHVGVAAIVREPVEPRTLRLTVETRF
jgi:hypothetical protein